MVFFLRGSEGGTKNTRAELFLQKYAWDKQDHAKETFYY